METELKTEIKTEMDFFVINSGTFIGHKLWSDDLKPQTFDQIIGQHSGLSILYSLMKDEYNGLPNILFSGPVGCGKSSITNIVINEYFNNNLGLIKNAVLKIDGSIHRSKNIITEVPVKKQNDKWNKAPNVIRFIKTSVNLPKNKTKIVVINDFECMTDDAQMGLRRIIEKYSSKVKFILICNHISGVIEAIQSRCINIKLTPITYENIVEYLNLFENHLPSDICELIALIANGDIRIALNMFQLFSGLPKSQQTIEYFDQIFNLPSVEKVKNIIEYCKTGKYLDAIKIVDYFYKEDYNIIDVLDIFIKVLQLPHIFDKKSECVKLIYIDNTIKCILKLQDTLSYIHLYDLIGKLITYSVSR